MFRLIAPVGCVTRYAPVEAKDSAPLSGSIEPLEMVRNELRTLRGILWVREKREKDGL